MQWRFFSVVTAGVLAAHWVILLPPLSWQWPTPDAEPLAPQRVAAVWVNPVMPPPAAPIALPLAKPSPAPPRPPQAKRPPNAAPPPTAQAPVASMHPPAPQPVSAPPLSEEAAPSADNAAPVTPALPANQDTQKDDSARTQQHIEGAPYAGPSYAGAYAAQAPVGPQLRIRAADHTPVALQVHHHATALAQHQQLHYRVHGVVKGMEYHAHAQLQWSLDDGHYQAQQTISAFLLGSMEQTSQGAWTAQGLVPLAFSDRRFAKRRTVHFDWDTAQAQFQPLRPAVPIGPGAQDRLSVFLQLAAMLQSMPALRQSGTQIEIPTLGTRSLQMWTFVVEHSETLELHAGAEPTLRLRRQPLAGDSAHGQLWLSPARGFLPARILLQESNGDVMELVLKP